MKQLTKEQAIIVTGYTGISMSNFRHFQVDVERRLQRPVWTHEFGKEDFMKSVKELYREDFIAICYREE